MSRSRKTKQGVDHEVLALLITFRPKVTRITKAWHAPGAVVNSLNRAVVTAGRADLVKEDTEVVIRLTNKGKFGVRGINCVTLDVTTIMI